MAGGTPRRRKGRSWYPARAQRSHGDGGKQKDGGGLGEDHEGKEEAKSEAGEGVAKAGLPVASLLRLAVGCGKEGQKGEEDEHGLEDGEAGEGVTEGADGEKEDRDCGGERGGTRLGGWRRESLPAAQEKPAGEQDEGEDAYGECARRSDTDAGEAEDGGLEQGPDGEGGRGVEVAGDVPVATLEVADGSVAVPAFVGVLGPVHPGRVVGEVGPEMQGVEAEEDRGDEKERDLNGLEETRRNGGQTAHTD